MFSKESMLLGAMLLEPAHQCLDTPWLICQLCMHCPEQCCVLIGDMSCILLVGVRCLLLMLLGQQLVVASLLTDESL